MGYGVYSFLTSDSLRGKRSLATLNYVSSQRANDGDQVAAIKATELLGAGRHFRNNPFTEGSAALRQSREFVILHTCFPLSYLHLKIGEQIVYIY